ncbi:hypothetical protein GCM10027019_07360 [Melaminivora jejuensis]
MNVGGGDCAKLLNGVKLIVAVALLCFCVEGCRVNTVPSLYSPFLTTKERQRAGRKAGLISSNIRMHSKPTQSIPEAQTAQ